MTYIYIYIYIYNEDIQPQLWAWLSSGPLVSYEVVLRSYDPKTQHTRPLAWIEKGNKS